MKGKLSGETAEHMRLLHGRVQRLDRLIEGILHYSRLGKPNTQDFAQVNTEELVHHVVEMLSPPPGFTITMTTPMPELQCTRLFFEQVMSNLISNAIKYRARDNGRVEISVREVGDYFEFSVADDGPGIEPQYHEKIFVIFQTLNARDDVESTGIGLAIVKKIVEKQGGKVTVKSAIGQGAKFIFTWPKSPAFAKQSATLEDKRQETGNLGRRVAPHLPNS